MSAWFVSFRSKAGSLETITIEADSRAEVFAELNRRGVSSIVRVEKSSDRPRTAHMSRGGRKMPYAIRGIVAGAVVVAAALAMYFMVFKNRIGEGRDGSNRRAAGVIPDVAPSAVQRGERRARTAKEIADEFSQQAKEFVKKATTNATQWIVPPLDPNDPDNALRTRVSQELGSLLSIEPGEPMPPFPYSFMLEDDEREAKARGEDVGEIDNGNKGFLESLKKYKVVAKETDDEHRLQHKERLIAAQSELLQAMDEGISVNDTIRAAYEFRKRAYETRCELSNLLRDISKEENMEIDTFKKQMEIANNVLKEKGIKAIAIEEILPDYEEPEDEQTDP